ncbi:MAG TPA: ATP synthase F1 subunit delta [Bryobacteraceae bacterium]|nr:ATP synthase F1 subunit delta [Bryobacteraceae bacterium]
MSLAVATRYANALAGAVIDSKGSLEPAAAVEQLRSLENAIESSHELRNALISPAIEFTRKKAIAGRLCDIIGMNRLVRNFVFIVVRNRRAGLLPQIREAFERQMDERVGVVRAEVASAFELTPPSREGLEAQLSRFTGKRVRAHYTVDGSLVGGVVARIGSTVYDGSVRGRLETLRRKLSAGA